jgi:hypothetical protein
MDDLLYLGVGIALFLATLWFVRGGDSTKVDPTSREADASGVRP